MTTASRRPVGAVGAALALAVLPLLATGPAVAADAVAAPAAADLVSGTEAAKAALVRIEVSATAHIAHVDASSGEAVVARGRYEVPIRSGTGVFTSSDGVIATAGSTLVVTEDEVVVHAANQLFQDQIGAELVGNDGDLSVRARAADPYWAPHLQHCYDQVTHCILFFVEKYTVLPWTREATSAPAELVRAPDGPGDVGLLRIVGGGGAPTAELAGPDTSAGEEALLVGFPDRPAPDVPVTAVPVGVDPGTGSLSPADELAGPLAAGIAGGPVLDPGTGAVTGLVATAGGRPTLVPVRALHEALEEAGAPPASSAFDVVFRRGIDHLASGQRSGSAVTSFQEALAYYDSALAAQHLGTAEAAAAGEPVAGAAAAGGGGGLGATAVRIALGVLAAALLTVAALVVVRRRTPGRRPGHAAPAGSGRAAAAGWGSTAPNGPGHAAQARSGPSPVPRGATPPADRSEAHGRSVTAAPAPARATSSDRDRTRLGRAPAMVRESVPPDRPATGPCANCGAPLREGWRFCGSCGSPVG
ncbi:zinc ribbon domain-containing protein [Geodermatophilus sp. YIM 151500]|uniref:zinc ribbon domain-containing protein n=1 Tax=Geodermatophilus sp. YIM 151500 TaxID=2984531 RepID=UPI0021E4D43F|nr:zinc ribbon domain-containing protein [Geodermatophilus sp. YIM 151500]MCV2491524.1 zinc ribbon domain-containing protein [Geodermatophilus sp. YIM 151500]